MLILLVAIAATQSASIHELPDDDKDDDSVVSVKTLRGYTKRTALASTVVFLSVIAFIFAFKILHKLYSVCKAKASASKSALEEYNMTYTAFYNMMGGEAYDDDFVENSLIEITRESRRGYTRIRR